MVNEVVVVTITEVVVTAGFVSGITVFVSKVVVDSGTNVVVTRCGIHFRD